MQSQPAPHHATPTASSSSGPSSPQCPFIRTDGFAVSYSGDIAHNADTAAILRSAGGADGVVAVITRFYQKFHADAHLKQFLGGLQQPLEVHARRLGLYIVEMMGQPSMPWSRDLKARERKVIELAHGRSAIAADRASAHYCAWNSKDRPHDKVGRRFKLDDCRVWMRLMFWALRDSGYDESAPFFRYMTKFVAHFIAIYEQTAREFTLLESRWSKDPAALDAYIRRGHYMADVVDVPLAAALKQLPSTERYGAIDAWLYKGAAVVEEADADKSE